jgi:alkylhydroperoxidase family enzyme
VPEVAPIPPEEIEDPGLGKLQETWEDLQVPDDLFLGILGRVPGYTKALVEAMVLSHAQGGVDHKLKEIIRIQLARTARDPYFANLRSQKAKRDGLTEEMIDSGSGDYENDPRFTEAEKWALRYADWMYRDPKRLDAAFYGQFKEHYTEAQIMELGAFIAFHYGLQVFMRTLRAFPLHDPDGNFVSQERSEQIYGSRTGR